MNEKKLILIGGGGHCKAVIDVALSADYTIMGILDNALEKGSTVLGIPVIGSDDDIKSIVEQYKDNIEFVISVGQIKSSAVRRALSSIANSCSNCTHCTRGKAWARYCGHAQRYRQFRCRNRRKLHYQHWRYCRARLQSGKFHSHLHWRYR